MAENDKGNENKAGITLTIIGVIIAVLYLQGGRGMNRKRKMDGTTGILQGGNNYSANAPSNVKTFPTDAKELSDWDYFLMKAGAKELANPKTTSPLEWNKSVLSLTATLIAILAVLVGFIWNYAVLSTKFELQQQRMNQLETDQKELKNEIIRFKEFQLKTDAYKLGAMENHGEKPQGK